MNTGRLWRDLPRALPGLVAAVLLTSCSKPVEVRQHPLVIRSDDVCAACGMYIGDEPGPRGEAYVDGESGVLKFGSTRDFFAYVTRADIEPRLESAYVQDTARIDWARPSGATDTFVDARKAYYVAWQPLSGEMGPTFASFAKRSDAEAFVYSHGGAILRFGQITAALVSDLGSRCPARGAPDFALASAAHCARRGEQPAWNIGAENVELTSDDVREIDEILAQVSVQGERYPERLQKLVER